MQTRCCIGRKPYNRTHVRSSRRRPFPVTTQRTYRTRRLELRIKEVMARKGVSSVVALHALLGEVGVEISHSQLTRIVNNQAELLNVEVMSGLMTVLRVNADELFGTRFGPPEGEAKTAAARRR